MILVRNIYVSSFLDNIFKVFLFRLGAILCVVKIIDRF